MSAPGVSDPPSQTTSTNPATEGQGVPFFPTYVSTPEIKKMPAGVRRTSEGEPVNPSPRTKILSGTGSTPLDLGLAQSTKLLGSADAVSPSPSKLELLFGSRDYGPSATQDDKEALEVADCTGPYKQLWNILTGSTEVMSLDVLHEELQSRCDAIITGLMLYEKPKPEDIPKLTDKSTHKEKLKVEIMKTLDVQEIAAMDLLCLYMVYEYTGEVKPLAQLFNSKESMEDFVKQLGSFYYRERLAMLYCAQVILSEATNEESRYCDIFTGFVSGASMYDWCKWLSMSLQRCHSAEETVEVMHTLAILLNNFAHCDGVLDALNEHCQFNKKTANKHEILLAEGVLLSSLLQCGEIQDDKDITKILVKHVSELDENPYCLGAIIAFFQTRSEHNARLGEVIRAFPKPENCVKNMTLLAQEYDEKSFRNKHGLGNIVIKCTYYNSEAILANFNKNSFGSDEEWFQLLNTILRDRATAQTFMCEQPNELTALFNDAMTFFPVDNRWMLSYWGALCRISTAEVTAPSILDRLAEINYAAEEILDFNEHSVRPNGTNEWTSLEERSISGIRVRAGCLGVTVRDATGDSPIIVSWALDTPCKNVSVWDILRTEMLRTAEEETATAKLICQVCAVSEFLWEFSESTKAFPPSMFQLVQPTTDILSWLAKTSKDPQEKSKFLVQLLKVIKSGGQFNLPYFMTNVHGVWPMPDEQNLVCELILAHESVLNSNYSVTKTFLLHMADLFQKDQSDPFNLLTSLYQNAHQLDIPSPKNTIALRDTYINAVRFILENIFPSFVRWRMKRSEDQFQIIRDTFRVFYNLYQFQQPYWTPVKTFCCETLLTAGSSLLAVLKIDEETLQDTWLRTHPQNMYLGQTIFYALSLIVQLAEFDIRTLKMLDNASNLTLVQKLGKLVRHRINPNIPTLALDLLKRIAQELNISVLACFGNAIDSFRDLLLQRLEYKTEHVQLKVVILDFLTVCAQAQPGLIQHFFQDNTLTGSLFTFLAEQDERLPLASLRLMRALFRKGNTILKKHPGDIWKLIGGPLKQLTKFSTRNRQKNVITYTMNIFCFELYSNGVSGTDFDALLREMLSHDLFQEIIIIASLEDNAETQKCLRSLKHFLIMLLSRPGFDSVLTETTRSDCLQKVTDEFWKYMNDGAGLLLLGPLAELMFLLAPSSDAEYLENFTGALVNCFAESQLPIQVPFVALIHKSIEHLKGKISAVAIENIVRIIATIYLGAPGLYDAKNTEMAKPLLAYASSTIHAMISLIDCEQWLPIFKRRCLINSLVAVTNYGLMRGLGPEIVQECLFALMALCERKETSTILCVSNLSQHIWTPAITFAEREGVDEKWTDVYFLCCQLNTAMLKSQKYYYLEDSLNFWGIHGDFMTMQLGGLTELIHHCYLHTPEQNYQSMKQLLVNDFTVLHALAEMVPYFQDWRIVQLSTLSNLMKGLFMTLETAVSLLSQPSHLLMVISKNVKPLTVSFKLTPQLLDMQTKLWEVLSMGINVCLKMKRDERELVNSEQLVQLLFSIVGVCGRGLSKHGDKKSHPLINVTSDVSMTLEKSLVLLLDHINQTISNFTVQKEELAFRRELTTEIMQICDILRRAGLPRDDFSLIMCSTLEAIVKVSV